MYKSFPINHLAVAIKKETIQKFKEHGLEVIDPMDPSQPAVNVEGMGAFHSRHGDAHSWFVGRLGQIAWAKYIQKMGMFAMLNDPPGLADGGFDLTIGDALADVKTRRIPVDVNVAIETGCYEFLVNANQEIKADVYLSAVVSWDWMHIYLMGWLYDEEVKNLPVDSELLGYKLTSPARHCWFGDLRDPGTIWQVVKEITGA